MGNQGFYVSSTGIVDGVIADKYGKHGSNNNEGGMPTLSFPLTFHNKPADTKSFAIVFEDKDAYPVNKGFSWIHWTAANITRDELEENASQTATDFVQGVNSWASLLGGSQDEAISSYYGGPAPPDCEHVYEVHVFALNTTLNLANGFYMNELYKAMEDHVLATYTLKGRYRS